MGGIVGRLFREFALTLSLAIVVSLAISLTTTPMMCAMFLKPGVPREGPKRRTLFDRLLSLYERSLAWSLRHGPWVMLILLITDRAECRALYRRAEGLFSAAGYRPDDGPDPG